jgi:hypothetical protein
MAALTRRSSRRARSLRSLFAGMVDKAFKSGRPPATLIGCSVEGYSCQRRAGPDALRKTSF